MIRLLKGIDVMTFSGFPVLRIPCLALAAVVGLSVAHAQSQAPCLTKNSLRLSQQGKFPAALAAVKGCGEGPATAKARGIAYYGLYQADSAIVYLKKAWEGGEQEDAVGLPLSEVLLWKKDFRSAAELMEKVKDKEGPAYLKVLARKHEILGEFPEAVKLYDRVIAREKLPYGSMERKAIVLSWMKKYDESIGQFEAIIRVKVVSRPLKVRCMVRKAEVISWKGEFGPALAEADKALALDGKNVEARLVKGRILEWQGEYKPAQTLYREILKWEPDNNQAKLRLEKLSWIE
jgi:tetratricopeptide (TPR) repeat protein